MSPLMCGGPGVATIRLLFILRKSVIRIILLLIPHVSAMTPPHAPPGVCRLRQVLIQC